LFPKRVFSFEKVAFLFIFGFMKDNGFTTGMKIF
jgi:hypothetical protein